MMTRRDILGDEEFITIDEAAVLLGCSRRAITVWIEAGLLPVKGVKASINRGPKPRVFSRTDVEALNARQEQRQLVNPLNDPLTLRHKVLARCTITAEDCWIWTGAMGSGRIPTMHLGCYPDGRQHVLAVRRWLCAYDRGYALPKGFDQSCPKSLRCINPDHAPLKYDLALIQYAVQALKAGQLPALVAKQYGLSRGLVSGLLDPEEREVVRRAGYDRTFWANVEITDEHWILLKRHNPMDHGTYVQAKHKAWLLSGRMLGPQMVLRRTCAVKSCIRPECQREIYAPGQRIGPKTRGAKTAQRHAEMAELAMVYGWTRKRVADFFGCSVSMVSKVVSIAKQRRAVGDEGRTHD
jgi:hypothetical protein